MKSPAREGDSDPRIGGERGGATVEVLMAGTVGRGSDRTGPDAPYAPQVAGAPPGERELLAVFLAVAGLRTGQRVLGVAPGGSDRHNRLWRAARLTVGPTGEFVVVDRLPVDGEADRVLGPDESAAPPEPADLLCALRPGGVAVLLAAADVALARRLTAGGLRVRHTERVAGLEVVAAVRLGPTARLPPTLGG